MRKSSALSCPPADSTQRFDVGDMVSHNAGVIDLLSKRQISKIIGYDPSGGVQYRLCKPDGMDYGLAYDCELDIWPDDDTPLPMISPRVKDL